MDWEEKFSSIVHETESNLAKVKQRLGSARTSVTAALTHTDSHHNCNPSSADRYSKEMSTSINLPLYGNSYLSAPLAIHSSPSTTARDWFPMPPITSPRFHQGDMNGFLNGLIFTGADPSLLGAEPLLTEAAPMFDNTVINGGISTSPAVIALLGDKIESQSRMIEKLMKAVHKLEKERHRHHTDITGLKDELQLVKSRLQEKGIDMATERKVESWRRDMGNELQLMHSQMQRLHHSEEERSMQLTHSSTISKDLYDLKRYSEDEMHSLRRDIDTMKSKIIKLEIELTGLLSDSSGMERRQDKLTKRVKTITDANTSASRKMDTTLQDIDLEKMQITELRSSMRSLHNKIGHIEMRIQSDSDTTPKKKLKSRREKLQTKPRKRQSNVDVLSPDTSELDLTDSSDYDLDLQSMSYALNVAGSNYVPRHTLSPDIDFNTEDLDITNTEDLLSLELEDTEPIGYELS